MSKLSVAAASSLVALLFALHNDVFAQAMPCEELRAEVEAKIRSNGVTAFSVEVVDAQGKVQGLVVGTCELGTKRLVYFRMQGPASASNQVRPATAASAAVGAVAKPPAVITECADGRVITSGSCKQ